MSGYETSLDLQALLEEARERSGGLTDLGTGPFIDPLKKLLASLESEGRLNPIGRIIARERILGHTDDGGQRHQSQQQRAGER